MKKTIENAIKEYIRKNGHKIEIDGKECYFSEEAVIEYISTYTCSPYDHPENATAWKNEYDQWKLVGKSSLDGNIQFSIQDGMHKSKVSLETTLFSYNFVEDEKTKIVINEMMCSEI